MLLKSFVKFLKLLFIMPCIAFAELYVEQVASGFDKPIFVIPYPNQEELLLVVEQKGVIRIVQHGHRKRKPFLDISDRVHRPLFPGDERGLLGLAFDPNFDSNSHFYLNYINKDGNTIVSRFNVSGMFGNTESEHILFELEQPYSNHNGGCMEFGQDGYLYISIGDGGSAGDPENRAQDLSVLFGKIIRIDVSEKEKYSIPSDNPFVGKENVKPEIWSYGLRNVWRFTFDIMTGDMVMGDVGQHLWEEINFETSSSNGGINYGWNILEGNHCYPEGNECNPDLYVPPIFEYPNNANYVRTLLGMKQKLDMDGCSVTGGYIYRGDKIKELQGKYIFGDYCTGKVWSLKINSDMGISDLVDHTSQILKSMGKREFYLSSFGQSVSNELFIIDYSGTVYLLKEN